jgi:hypothetical protein
MLQARARCSGRRHLWALPARSRPVNSALDISPSKAGMVIANAATMLTLRSIAEMGLLVSAAVVVLVLASLVL